MFKPVQSIERLMLKVLIELVYRAALIKQLMRLRSCFMLMCQHLDVYNSAHNSLKCYLPIIPQMNALINVQAAHLEIMILEYAWINVYFKILSSLGKIESIITVLLYAL